MNNKPGAALRALRKKHTISCAVCGATHEAGDARARYCSNRCKQAAKYQRAKAERSSRTPEREPGTHPDAL